MITQPSFLSSRAWRVGLILACLLAIPAAFTAGAPSTNVSLITDAAPASPVRHGLTKLKLALQQKGVAIAEVASLTNVASDTVVVAGLASGTGEAARLVADLKLAPPTNAESLLIRKFTRRGKSVLLVTGTDARGLMYALLDVADRVGWPQSAEQPFSNVGDAEEKPYTPERALSIYTFNRSYWESRFYDEAYWAKYLDVLAQNRFNSLVVIFGYENGGFLAPCYPYFFDVEGFPDVRMVGITPEQQKRNLTALNRLIQMAHDRGVNFTVGIWDHIYRGGVQGGGIPGADEATQKPVPGLVWGVTGSNLVSYTKAALARFVQAVPAADAIQFRMHDESGLRNSEQESFWRDVFQMMKEKAPNLRLDLRAKGLPDSVIQSASEVGVKFRITTKYWMEQMGLPFHPTHINQQNQFDRRHSFADMLRYPQPYKMHWRLWNGGTARVLLWADPDYARRFAESTHLYDGDGFEVNEPLCTKMEAQPHDATPFDLLTPSRRYYDFEFERYWHFFQAFGRVGYNPDTPPEVWRREFEKRFGKEAAPFVEQGLHQASRVLPRIVASCYPYGAFPMTRGWAEKQRLGDLPAYAKAEGSDIQQFANFDEEAQLLLERGETAKIRPAENSRWFAQTAAAILSQIAEAEQRVGDHRTKEFDSTITDLKMLAQLGLFHARRIPAAVCYRLFDRTRDVAALDDAITYERNAIIAWQQLVTAAGDFYTEDLRMGVRGANLCGHWKDELAALEKGLASLERQRAAVPPTGGTIPAPHYTTELRTADGEPPVVIHQAITKASVGKPLILTAKVRDPSGVKWVRLRYRNVNQHEDYRTLPMLPTGEKDHYRATIPAEQVGPTWDLMYFIEAMDQQGNGRIYPDLNEETPYVVTHLQHSEADFQTSRIKPQEVPVPLPDHPGNVFLEGENVSVPWPQTLPPGAAPWRLLDDQHRILRTGTLPSGTQDRRTRLQLGSLEIGWYRLEFELTNQASPVWTSLAVLRRLRAPIPGDSPVAVDSATAWFAQDDPDQQKRLANLAALAGVGWVRDRLRWRDIQPQPGALKAPPTTYDTSAEAQRDAGLHVLQVFHDTPPWTRDKTGGGGRFASDLRHVYRLGRELAVRFKGRVGAWEPWNEANVATFGAHTVDQMCSWQKAAWLGFKAGDPEVIVGWNPTAAVPTPAHTAGLLANEVWPYFDTYNIHTYDWSHAYADLWKPAREAAAGRPIWITEADRGTPHLKNPPWFDQEPRLERLKAEWMAQAYASSLFAGAQRHFHFVLGNYQEPNGVQFGLLRLDLTPRPAYVALAAVSRGLAGAKILGRWQPGQQVQVYAFRARPDGQDRDVLVAWAEKEVDWAGRGATTAPWTLPARLTVQEIVDYLGRPLGTLLPKPLTSAPVFVFLPAGQAASLPLEVPAPLAPWREGTPSPVVLQLSGPRSAVTKVEDVPWSEGYAYQAAPGRALDLELRVYNFATNTITGRLQVAQQPQNWAVSLPAPDFKVPPMDRASLAGTLRIPSGAAAHDGWVVLRADCNAAGRPTLAFRVLARK